MGALRFKTVPDGPFLDNDDQNPTPPWSSLGDLQEAVSHLENDRQNDAIRQWIAVLIAPGSSLGGARPKANILGKDKDLWIAKFPSKTDTVDNAAWNSLPINWQPPVEFQWQTQGLNEFPEYIKRF